MGLDHLKAAHFILQVAVILLAAKGAGLFFRRCLKQPTVLGEILAGVIIGPFALGGISLPWMGPFFPLPAHPERLAVSYELYSLTLVGSVVLLFTAGLETDLGLFLRYSGAGLATAFGGAITAFCLGDAVAVWLGMARSYVSPEALCMGSISLATSVGLTVAVLSEMRRLDTPEGATILSAAVIDDVIGIVVLAVVISLVSVERAGELKSGGRLAHVAWVIGKAVLFWFVAIAGGILASRPIRVFLRAFGGSGAMSTVGLALALFLSALAEKFGLALIIGAYTMGLALSRLDMAHEIRRRMTPLYEFLVPLFFCVSGMMVDVRSFGGVLGFALIYTVVAIVAKLVGCGLCAGAFGFNLRGQLRIGLGMTPRQEVALIVAGVALARGAISNDLYGAGIFMTLAATLVTPPALARAFRGPSGLRREKRRPLRELARFRIELPSPEVAELVAERMAKAFQAEEFYAHIREGVGLYEMRKADIVIFMQRREKALEFATDPTQLQYARFVVLEEMLELNEVFRVASRSLEMDALRRSLLAQPERPE